MPNLPDNFALLEEEHSTYETAGTVILPVPFERTTSYGKGTFRGPEAILRASHYLEVYDEELEAEPYRRGIATRPAFVPEAFHLEEALRELETECRRHLEAGKLLVVLGGEHSLSIAPIRAARAVCGEIGVVQFDAHADLRDEYEGTPWSHACIMRRVLDESLPSLAVGIRSLSTPEAEVVRREGLRVIWGHQLEGCQERFSELLDELPDRVYLTFDVDYFDPSLMPATGTPEPGGGHWYPTLELLRTLFARKEVVAMDVVELSPLPGYHAADFLAAKLIYKCLGYRGCGIQRLGTQRLGR